MVQKELIVQQTLQISGLIKTNLGQEKLFIL